MKYILLTFVLVQLFNAAGQDQLINTYTTKSSIAGGTPDSGTSTTVQYTFVAKKKLTLLNIEDNERPIILEKNDTIRINYNTFVGYNFGLTDDYEDPPTIQIPNQTFKVYEYRSKKYVTVKMMEELKKALQYEFKGEKFQAICKETIDKSNYSAAP